MRNPQAITQPANKTHEQTGYGKAGDSSYAPLLRNDNQEDMTVVVGDVSLSRTRPAFGVRHDMHCFKGNRLFLLLLNYERP